MLKTGFMLAGLLASFCSFGQQTGSKPDSLDIKIGLLYFS